MSNYSKYADFGDEECIQVHSEYACVAWDANEHTACRGASASMCVKQAKDIARRWVFEEAGSAPGDAGMIVSEQIDDAAER